MHIIILDILSSTSRSEIPKQEPETLSQENKRLKEENEALKSKLENRSRNLLKSLLQVRELKKSRLPVDSLVDSLSKLKSFHLKTVGAYQKKLKMFKSKLQTLYTSNRKDGLGSSGHDSLLGPLFRLCSHCGNNLQSGNLQSPKFDFFLTYEEMVPLSLNSSFSDSDKEDKTFKVSLSFVKFSIFIPHCRSRYTQIMIIR